MLKRIFYIMSFVVSLVLITCMIFLQTTETKASHINESMSDSTLYMPIIRNQPAPTPTPSSTPQPLSNVHIDNDTGGRLCFEILGTNIGEKCFSSGTHHYGNIPIGTYSWRASADCGTSSGTEFFGAGVQEQRFWCSYAASIGPSPEWPIYLPMVQNEGSLALRSTPTPTNTPTSSLEPTPTPTNTPEPLLADHVPCLLVLTGNVEGYPACVPSSGVEALTEWRYADSGAIIGFDYTVLNSQDVTVYHASIDIQRSSVGAIESYSGTISSEDSPTFTENIANTYNDVGGFVSAEVTKVYPDSGTQYTMRITRICTLGYKVIVFESPFNGDEVTVGSCS